MPTEWGSALTHILVVEDLTRATAFYRDVIGAEVERETERLEPRGVRCSASMRGSCS